MDGGCYLSQESSQSIQLLRGVDEARKVRYYCPSMGYRKREAVHQAIRGPIRPDQRVLGD